MYMSILCICFIYSYRYERKKNILLAVEALDVLLQRIDPSRHSDIMLVVAGGYDTRVEENVSYYSEIESLVSRKGLQNR